MTYEFISKSRMSECHFNVVFYSNNKKEIDKFPLAMSFDDMIFHVIWPSTHVNTM